MVLDVVCSSKRNLITMCFDFKKTFDGVSHESMLIALEHDRVLLAVMQAIRWLMKCWAAQLCTCSTTSSKTTVTIQYHTVILQGDCLAKLLFILSINPWSFWSTGA